MKKSKHYTREFRSDDPSTYMTNVEQQKNMLLDTITDDAIAKKIKKYDFAEPDLNKDLDQFAESRARYETLRNKRKAPEKIEKNNSGLAGILQISKRIKD